MDKRFFLALVLTAIVIVGTPLLFPGARRPASSVLRDSTSPTAQHPDSTRSQATPSTSPTPPGDSSNRQLTPPGATAVVETTTVQNSYSTYAFSSHGGVPISVTLDSYPSRRPRGKAGLQHVELTRPGSALMNYRIAVAADTVALNAIPLRRVQSE